MKIHFNAQRSTPGALKALSAFCTAIATDMSENPTEYPQHFPSFTVPASKPADEVKSEPAKGPFTASPAAVASEDELALSMGALDVDGEPALDGQDVAPLIDDDVARDEKGVAFHKVICSTAKKPFYASGARSGQWKKRNVVEFDDYDKWYAEQLASVPVAATQPAGDVDVAGAFANAGGESDKPEDWAPATAGELMVWVAEHQTAGTLAGSDLTDAYNELKLDPTAIFPSADNPEEAANDSMHNVFQYLLACIDNGE